MSEYPNITIDVIQSKDVDISSPYVFVGLPDAGLVGIIAANYLIEKRDMKELGYIDSTIFPPLVIVRDGEVKNPVRLYFKDNFVVVISDIPIAPPLATQFAKSLVKWFKKLDPKLIVNVTGVPVQNRQQLEKLDVFALATDGAKEFADSDLKLFNDGALFGAYASIIKECVSEEIPTLTLLAQSYMNFPDPTASIEALSMVNKLLNTNIDLKELEEEAEMIRIRTRKLMKQTEGAMQRTKAEAPPKIYG